MGRRCNATGRNGIYPLEKVISGLRALCYRVPADYLEEKMQIGESIALECMTELYSAVISGLKDQYLAKQSGADIVRTERQFVEL